MILFTRRRSRDHARTVALNPFLSLPRDQPSYEDLSDLTMAEKAALPTRFHTPVWMDSIPGVFICRVCWDGPNARVTEWPCPTAKSGGRDLFESERYIQEG